LKAHLGPHSSEVLRLVLSGTRRLGKAATMNDQSPTVLIADDKIQSRRSLRTDFELNGFIVHEVDQGHQAIRAAMPRPLDVIIVNLGLSDMDGAEVIERIRSSSSVPIIVLSIKSGEQQKVHLLELGADDFIVKPFGMAELLARVRVMLRRQSRTANGEQRVTVGPLTIDLAARTVLLNSRRLTLTPKEYRLLQVLAQHAGKSVTHQHLLTVVWGSVHAHDTHYLRILVRKLRQKIEPLRNSPKVLMTESGVGYRLTHPIQEEEEGNQVIDKASERATAEVD
jgi:two-component system, OmpR family, KDP operon response regulator KdpE